MVFKHTLNVRLHSDQCAFPVFVFLAGSHGTVHDLAKNVHTKAFLGPTELFTPLKIILLQCFQFSVNKRYPNTPLMLEETKNVGQPEIVFQFFFLIKLFFS